jgi:3-oxoacyl-[acyl-carrier protein] reductase
MSGNKVAVVTGGRRGIGRATALALARQGYDLVVTDIANDDDARQTLDQIRAAGVRTHFVRADITDDADVTALCDEAFGIFGRVDALVNSAGVQVADRNVDVLDMSRESFDRLIRVNLRGTFFVTQAFARRMVQVEAAEGARTIVTVSSANATHARSTGAEYCMSKAALTMMNHVFALRLAAAGIFCYEVQPGLIRTDMNRNSHERLEPVIAAGLTPLARWGEADDVGETIAALAGGALRFCTGETLHVDGGLHVPKSPFESPFVQRALL